MFWEGHKIWTLKAAEKMWKFVTVEDGMRNVCAAKKEMIYAVGHYICNSLVLKYEFQNIKLSM